METIFYDTKITMATEICCTCGIIFAVTQDFQNRVEENHKMFYCPSGHTQSYTHKSKEQELKEVRAKLELAERNHLYEESKRMEAERKLKLADKKLKRVHNGVCPCCNRSFENLRNHMQTKHPDEFKNFIELINNPNSAVKKGTFLNQLTIGEKRKLKKK